MKVGAIIQARMTSSRLPGKVLMPLFGKPALERMIERVKLAKLLDEIIIATTVNETDDPIVQLCEKLDVSYYRGSEEDVLSRVLEAAKEFKLDTIVELTGDCPLIDPEHIDTLVMMHSKNDASITSNALERSFSRGYDIRVFNTATLDRVNQEVDNPVDRQHVSTWMYLNPKGKLGYKAVNWTAPKELNRPDIEVTLDTPEDYELLNWVFSMSGQGYNLDLTCKNVIGLIDQYPYKYKKVKTIVRKDYFKELEEAYHELNKIPFCEEEIEEKTIKKPLNIVNELFVKRSKSKNAKTGAKRGRKPRKKSV